MSVIIGLLLASALSQASTGRNAGSWMSDDDYPAGALKRREEGTVAFSLLISPKGRIIRCAIKESSGSADLDERTCTIIRARGKFNPATDENGAPAFSEFTGRLTWMLPGKSAPQVRRRRIPPSDIELQVQKLPGGAQDANVTIITRLDTSGHVVVCEGLGDDGKAVQLVKAACAQVNALPLVTTKDDEGIPISLIRSLRVTFRVAS